MCLAGGRAGGAAAGALERFEGDVITACRPEELDNAFNGGERGCLWRMRHKMNVRGGRKEREGERKSRVPRR